MKLRPNEERALEEAVPAWRAVNAEVNKHAPGKKVRHRRKFDGETPDEILARYGITLERCFTGEYHRYGIVETEMRRRARRRSA